MFSNPMQMLQAFNQFRANFQGDPQQVLQELISSGRISQGQLNQLQSMAQQFMSLIEQFR